MPRDNPVYRKCAWCGDFFWSLRLNQKCCCEECSFFHAKEKTKENKKKWKQRIKKLAQR